MLTDPKTVAVLITCHNRKEKTIRCLESLRDQDLPHGLKLKVIVVDDGSTDGTSQAIKEQFPSAVILKGNGNLYWAGGMRKAIEYAIEGDYDFHLWLNDDTILFKETIKHLFDDYRSLPERAILAGATVDPDNGNLTYGGFKRKFSYSPLHLKLVGPQGSPVVVDCMNGNCVLVPKVVFNAMKNLDGKFTHGLADLDYGLSASRKGIKVYLSSDFIGICKRNEGHQNRNILTGIKNKLSLKNMPFKEWQYYVKKNGGWLWPYYMVAPYIKAFIKG